MSFKGKLDSNGEEYLHKDHREWWKVKAVYEGFFLPDDPDTLNVWWPIPNRFGGDISDKEENFRIFKIIEGIYKEEIGVTETGIKAISGAINALRNNKETSFVFEESLTSDIATGMLELVRQNQFMMLLLIVDGIREITVDSSAGLRTIALKQLKYEKVEDSVKTWVKGNIIKIAEENKIDEYLGKLPAEIIKKDYSLAHYKEEMSKRINAMIQDVDGVTRVLGFTEKFYKIYINLSQIDDGGKKMYHLSESIYVDGKFTKVPADAIDAHSNLKSLFEYPNVFNYPLTIIRDQINDEVEQIKEDLRNFSTLNGKNISEYPFVFLKDTTTSTNIFGEPKARLMSDGWALGALKWFYEDRPPADLINKTISQNYFTFLRSLSKDIFDNSKLTTSIGGHFNAQLTEEKIKPIFDLIAFDKIVAAKKAFFDNLAREASDTDETPGELTEEEIENALKNQLKAFEEGEAPDLEEMPSEEDIENRKKFFKQCALMLNISDLRDTYQTKLFERYAGGLPFDGRFTTVYAQDGKQETILSNLVSSADEQKLFELESHKVSRLVPKVRLFKVFYDGSDTEKEVEFIFDRSSTLRSTFMSSDALDKGTGVGLKNFSFEFNGTTPATARNDISASLTLFFQSFNDFLNVRNGTSGDKYRYVDLIIQPTPDDNGKVGGVDVQSDRQYEPQFYRIRADVGYVLPTEADGFTSEEIQAIRVSNKSFFLNMVDHDISFGKDGTVEIKISYRAYLESLLKHPKLDALASPELIAKRIENARELTTQLNKKECSVEQIKELQISLAAQEAVLVKQSLSSIIKRLRSRGVIYNTLIKKEDKEFFLKKGFFNKCEFETSAIGDGADGVDVKLVLNSDLPESSEDFNFIDSDNRSIQFFYFGDLLYTILDCVYETGGRVREGTGFDRNSIMLGSFEFEPFQESGASTKVYNIADIPISVDFFSRWFVDNVVSQESTRRTFPVMNFIRNFSNYLIKPSLIENCVNRKMENRLRFQTTQITAFSNNGVNPLKDYYSLPPSMLADRPMVALDVSRLRDGKEPPLPLKGGPVNDANSSFKDYHTFIVLNALGSTLSYSGGGVYDDDIKNGRYHVHVGQNSGLVKTLSLSKSDQQYIREARFFQNGIDGLLQLSAVYVANIEMFGNTLFYPGMEFFFNPFGIGGSGFDPTKAGSDANKLGIGGYHTITSVKSSISPGKFTTSISGQQYYSGDGSGNPNIVKKKKADSEAAGDIGKYVPEETEGGYANCNKVILAAQNYAFEEGTLAGSLGGGSTESSVETPREEGEEE